MSWPDCVETVNSRNEHGYGCTGARRFGRRIYLTHVLAWVDHHGQLPPAETPCILHHCDNPPCVNPDHLYAGTQMDNMRDASRRKRLANQRKTECPRCGGVFVEYRGKRCCMPCSQAGQRERDRKKYADLERRAVQLVQQKKRLADPKVRVVSNAKHRAWQKKRRADPEYRIAMNARERERRALKKAQS